MRLINADALKEMIPTTSVDMFGNCRNCSLLSEEQVNELIDMTPTVNSRTYTLEEVAEILHGLFGDDCACNYNGIDEWLPQSCKYADTECPDPKEKHGCWKQFLLQGAYVEGMDFGKMVKNDD